MTKLSANSIQLIVGLCNPGAEYDGTRHNAGAWFVQELARECGASLLPDRKFFGDITRVKLHGQEIRLLLPSTYMNRSGQSVAAVARYYKIAPEAILVAHDELDIPPGTARLKQGGGHGGHNGLRDMISQLGSNNFQRLRIGIGHPGDSKQVVNYVLGRPSRVDQDNINACLDEAVRIMPELLNGSRQKAIQQLHSFKA